ncbi:MAG: hypothetical protein RIR49_1736, partial [Actinomycetota bacterium]
MAGVRHTVGGVVRHADRSVTCRPVGVLGCYNEVM